MRRLTIGLAVVGSALAAAAPAARADVTTQFFAMPAGITQAGAALAVAPVGTVFFGAEVFGEGSRPIGRLNPALAVPGTAAGMTTVETPDNSASNGFAGFRDFSYSVHDQALYWTRSDNTVGKLVGDTATRADVPVSPWGIVAAPGGGAWMTENGAGPGTADPKARAGSRVAQVGGDLSLTQLPNLQTYAVGEDPDLRFDAEPQGITLATDGTPWFTEANPGNPGYRIGKVSGTSYVEYSAPCGAGSPCSGSNTGTGLTDLTFDQTGAIWYTNELKHLITKMIPGGQQTEYPLAGLGAGLGAGVPRSIATASDGTLWVAVNGGYSSPSANAILHIVPSTLATSVYKLGAAVQPFTVVPDTARGSVWFTGSAGTGGSSLGRLAGVDGVTDPGPGTDPGTGGGGEIAPVVIPTTTPTVTTTTTLQPGVTADAKVTNPVVKGDSISANQICVGPPQDRCSLVYLIQTHEYVTGFPNTNGYAAKVAKKLTTIGTLKVTLKGGQKKKVTIKLNSKGKKLRKKMAFKATLTVTQAINGSKPKTVLKKNLKFKK